MNDKDPILTELQKQTRYLKSIHFVVQIAGLLLLVVVAIYFLMAIGVL